MTDISEKNKANCTQNYTQKDHNLEKLKEKWPSPFVSRDRIEEFTGGLFKQSSMNTLDSMKQGITPRYAKGHKVFYEVDDVILWLTKKIKNTKGRSSHG
jgi:hypothetical protein